MTPEHRRTLIIETIRAIQIGTPVSKGLVTIQPSVEKEGAVFQAGNIRPALPEMNCDLDKSDPVARDWHKESRPRAP
jgi:hypothetical protein